MRPTHEQAMASQRTLPRFLLPQSSWIAAVSSRGSKSAVRANPHALRWSEAVSKRTLHGARQLPPRSTAGRGDIVPRSAFRSGCQANKCFSTSTTLQRDHHFDTLKFVQRLRDEGFSEEQSKAMMLVLSDVIEESIQNLTRTMVLKEGEKKHNENPLGVRPPR